MAVKLSELMGPVGSTVPIASPIWNAPTPTPVGMQQQAKPEEDQYSLLSKAFKGFSNAAKTPGFQQVMGLLGVTLAPNPESWQAKLGAAGASLGKGRQYDSYLSKLLAGQTPTPQDAFGLSPEEQTQAQTTAKTLMLKQAEQATAEKSQAASGLYQERLGTAALQAQQNATAQLPIQQQEADARTKMAAKGDFRMESVPSGGPGQEQTYVLDATTGQYKPVTSGQRQTGGSGGMTPYQEAGLEYRDYDRRLNAIAYQYADKGIVVYKNPDGTTGVDMSKAPDEVKTAYMQSRRDMVIQGIKDGAFPDGFQGIWLDGRDLTKPAAIQQTSASTWPRK